jgi:hypothetical protein
MSCRRHLSATCGHRFRHAHGAVMDRYRTLFMPSWNTPMNRSITGPVPPSKEGGTRSGGPAGSDVGGWHDRGRDAGRGPLA